MRNLFIIIVGLYSASLHSQSKQDYVWLFGLDQVIDPGTQGYRIDFKDKPFKITISDNGLGMDGSNASVCDKDGNLLFHSNGCAVFNKNAEIMPNGDSLNYDQWVEVFNWQCKYGYPGFHNMTIIPDPANQNGYYLFHKRLKYNGPGTKRSLHLMQSYIDMNLNNDLGDVLYKNKILFDSINVIHSYLSAIQHENKRDWWLFQPLEEDSLFLTYLISPDGIQRQENQNTHFKTTRDFTSASGTLRFNNRGTQMALYNYFDGLHLYDFDRASGKLSNHQKVNIIDSIDYNRVNFSGIEYSPSDQFIYLASEETLHQVDLYATQGISVRLVKTYDGTLDPFPSVYSHMALGPDCRIYICPQSGTNSYHVINKPDQLDCDFVPNGIKLPLPSGAGSWPNHPRYRVDEMKKCDPSIVSVFGDDVYFRRELEVFPNPSSGLFTIKLPELIGEANLIVTNINGQVIYTKKIMNSIIEEINITAIPNGMYNIEVYPLLNPERIYYGRQVVKI